MNQKGTVMSIDLQKASASARKKFLMASVSFAGLVVCVSVPQALAQQAAEERGVLETITVTAQRYSEDLQKTPVAVSAFSADALAERQAFNLRDMQSLIPGAVIQNVVALQTAPRIFFRGVGQDSATFNSDNAVGTYIDGIYVPR